MQQLFSLHNPFGLCHNPIKLNAQFTKHVGNYTNSSQRNTLINEFPPTNRVNTNFNTPHQGQEIKENVR